MTGIIISSKLISVAFDKTMNEYTENLLKDPTNFTFIS